MKVLLASDGSDCSDRAAKYVARALRAQVKELSVTLMFVDPPMMARVKRALGESVVERIVREDADFNLKQARRRLQRAGVAFEELVAEGLVADCIATNAKKGKFDLVVMGTHGRGSLGNLLLGSVTTRLLTKCTVPVLVVP